MIKGGQRDKVGRIGFPHDYKSNSVADFSVTSVPW